jgi:outer membrane immunogenic protein
LDPWGWSRNCNLAPLAARAEYRYADFGSAAFTIIRTNATSSTIDNFDVRLRTHTLNFGLAYRFN